MREEELRSRLQALAVAGRGTPEPAAFGAVRRRARRKLQGAAALVVGLVVAVAGVWLAADAVRHGFCAGGCQGGSGQGDFG